MIFTHKRWEKTSELFYHCKDQIISDKGSSFEKAVAFFIVNRVSFSGLTISSSVSKSNTDTHFNLNSILKLSEYSKIIKNWENLQKNRRLWILSRNVSGEFL